MITKIDNPKKAESKDYDNKGGVGRLKNYLVGNDEKIDKNDLFFDFKNDNISGDEVQELFDKNVKGLRKEDHKFFSISLNPSKDELDWIKNDKQKFKEYVRESMRNYCRSFKDGNVKVDDLVWKGIIHEKRFYTDLDLYKWKKRNGGEPPFKSGDVKPGSNMHAHIIVSARDNGMTKTLNVLTAENRISRKFELKGFQKRNQDGFQKMFYFKEGVNIYRETQKIHAEKSFDQLHKLGFALHEEFSMAKVGDKMEWNGNYTRNLKRLVQETYKGNYIANPEVFLELGDKKYKELYPDGFQEGGFRRPAYESEYENWGDLIETLDNVERASSNNMEQKDSKILKKRRRKRSRGM